MHNFKELKIWNNSMDLAMKVYKQTSSFPSEEKFNLISQIRRSAVSIPSNIAEGAGRNHNKEFNQFLGIARGSSFELETQLILSNRLNYLENEKFAELNGSVTEIQRMIAGFQSKLLS